MAPSAKVLEGYCSSPHLLLQLVEAQRSGGMWLGIRLTLQICGGAEHVRLVGCCDLKLDQPQ